MLTTFYASISSDKCNFQLLSTEGLRVIKDIVRRETVDAPASRGSRIDDFSYNHDDDDDDDYHNAVPERYRSVFFLHNQVD